MNEREQEYLALKIRAQYVEKEHTELDALRDLDKRVKTPANIAACVFGSISALIMGAGMSLIMTNLGASIGLSDPTLPGLVVGVVGMLAAIINYPVYRKILNRRRARYADRIIELSDKIMND